MLEMHRLLLPMGDNSVGAKPFVNAGAVCSIFAFSCRKYSLRPLRLKRLALRYHSACKFCKKSPP